MINFAYLIEPPFNFRDETSKVTGSDVELARAVLALAGEPSLNPIETEFAQLIPGVRAGRWRMTTGLFDTSERRSLVSFSRPIWALPDGLLVRRTNPKGLIGYRSAAMARDCVIAVVRDQFQHRSVLEFGVPEERVLIFETYTEAATAVLDGRADGYASVARAHYGFLDQARSLPLEVVPISQQEKKPAFGAFAFDIADPLRAAVDAVLKDYLGSSEHRAIMKRFGFDDAEVDLIAG